MCEQVLGIEPAGEDKNLKPRISQGEKWVMHLTAARQHFERDGHIRLPRKHVETITVNGDSGDQKQRPLKLGAWVANQRTRAATLTRSGRSGCPRSECGGPPTALRGRW
ncbi:Helicase associated domain protein [Streptomyces sp. ADI92-24]|nr:Helicase associated domain protein [Streptomyces sp. ADI92-24]